MKTHPFDCKLKLYKYKPIRVRPEWGRYVDSGRPSLTLHFAPPDPEDPSPLSTASVNLPEHPCPEGHIFVRTWAGEEGMLESLVEAGLVEDTGTRVPTGYVEAALCRIL